MKRHYKSAEIYYIQGRFAIDRFENDYLRVVHNYIHYYYRTAEIYKWWYLVLCVVKLLILATIPVIQTISQMGGFPWVTAGLSGVCILLESVIQLFKMKEKWILYRRAGNDLMHEERKYVMGVGMYHANEQERMERFVECVESLIINEAYKWNEMIQSIKTSKDS